MGKQRIALWLSQLLLCEAPASDGPCDSCRNCRRVLRLEHPDLHWFFPLVRPKGASGDKLGQALEEARFGRLAELREAPLRSSYHADPVAIYLAAAQELRRKARSRPAESGDQIFIIGDAETLIPQESSPEAANALLKLLEEPPEDTRFILTSSQPGRLLDTIRSRTVPLQLSPLAVDVTAGFLQEQGVDDDAAHQAARLSGGSIGMALGFLLEDGEPGPLEALRRQSVELLRAGITERAGDGYAAALGFKVSGARALAPLLDFLEIWLRDLAAVAAGSPDDVVNLDALTFLENVSNRLHLHPAAVTAALTPVEQARREARGNVNPQLIIAGLTAGLREALVAAPLTAASHP